MQEKQDVWVRDKYTTHTVTAVHPHPGAYARGGGSRGTPLGAKMAGREYRAENDLQGRQVFPLAGTPLGKFLATLQPTPTNCIYS